MGVLLDNTAQHGGHVTQPSTFFRGHSPEDTIATLKRLSPIQYYQPWDPIIIFNVVDGAIAKLLSSSDISVEIHDIGYYNLFETYSLGPQDVLNQTQVQKTGMKTGHTVGYVEAIDWVGKIPKELYGVETEAWFASQIKVRKLGSEPVAWFGDSGALVLTMAANYPKICGLLFAGNEDGAYYLANPIDSVVRYLDLDLPCAFKEAVRGTEAEMFLPDLRALRDELTADRRLAKTVERLVEHSVHFLDDMLRKPKHRRIASALVADIGASTRDKSHKSSKDTARLGRQLIDVVAARRKQDSEFLSDMKKTKTFMTRAQNKTLPQVIKMMKGR